MLNRSSQTMSSVLRYLQVILFAAVILYFGKILFIPLFLGLLIAIIMHPVAKWFESVGFSKTLAITVCLFIVAVLITLLLVILIWQVNVFGNDAPEIINRLKAGLHQFQLWIVRYTSVSADLQHSWAGKLLDNFGSMIGSGIQTTFDTLFISFLTPVYTALFMYHRKIFVQYLQLIIPERHHPRLHAVIQQTIHTYFNYIKGMLLVYLIVGILNSIGLMAFGVKHAILFGMLCAVMTIIPYVGIFISALLPISIIWIETGNLWYPLGVTAMFAFVQYLEANVIFPKVVGTQLNVSTLAMLVAIIAGGIIWGVAGMILFIPFVAMLKIISDNIEEWKPINLLLSR